MALMFSYNKNLSMQALAFYSANIDILSYA